MIPPWFSCVSNFSENRIARFASSPPANLGPKHIGVIERGIKTSSFDAVEKLANALDVEYYQFFISQSPRRTAGIEKEINALLTHPRKIDLQKMEEFLRDLRALLRKLDKTASPGA